MPNPRRRSGICLFRRNGEVSKQRIACSLRRRILMYLIPFSPIHKREAFFHPITNDAFGFAVVSSPTLRNFPHCSTRQGGRSICHPEPRRLDYLQVQYNSSIGLGGTSEAIGVGILERYQSSVCWI